MLKSIESLVRTQIPTIEEIQTWDQSLKSSAKCVNGVLASLDLGKSINFYIYPSSIEVQGEDGETTNVVTAYCINCPKPATYGMIINAAEKQEYDEANAGEITAINRKGRQNPEDEEVLVHDNFISYIKTGLHQIGIS